MYHDEISYLTAGKSHISEDWLADIFNNKESESKMEDIEDMFKNESVEGHGRQDQLAQQCTAARIKNKVLR